MFNQTMCKRLSNRKKCTKNVGFLQVDIVFLQTKYALGHAPFFYTFYFILDFESYL